MSNAWGAFSWGVARWGYGTRFPKFCHVNALETANVSIAEGGADMNFPAYRLYDRNIERVFKPSGQGKTVLKIDRMAETSSVDRLIVIGPKIEGVYFHLAASDDDSIYEHIGGDVGSSGGALDLPFSSIAKRYFRLEIDASGFVPELSEVFLTATHEWAKNPLQPVEKMERAQPKSVEIADEIIVEGRPRRRRVYKVGKVFADERDELLALYATHSDGKAFFFFDLDGELMYGRLKSELNITEEPAGRYSFDFDFIEVPA